MDKNLNRAWFGGGRGLGGLPIDAHDISNLTASDGREIARDHCLGDLKEIADRRCLLPSVGAMGVARGIGA
jgi:hypothetical protein